MMGMSAVPVPVPVPVPTHSGGSNSSTPRLGTTEVFVQKADKDRDDSASDDNVKNELEAAKTAVLTTMTTMTTIPTAATTGPVDANNAAVAATARRKAAEKVKTRRVSRWILFQLWFGTYRRFFVLVTTLNLVGIVLAAVGKFPYADDHLGALVLGNLLCAILMRNELFLRFLYLISIYGLKGVSLLPCDFCFLLSLADLTCRCMLTFQWAPLCVKLAVTSVLQHVGGIHSGCALSGAGYVCVGQDTPRRMAR